MRFEDEIRREANRLIVRHETQGRLLAEEEIRRSRRSIAPQPKLPLQTPSHWLADPGFNPYLTRAHSARIAHSIRSSFSRGQFRPRNPYSLQVPKKGGGTRNVCIYQVADGAVSKMLFETVLKKNLPILSARAYAYRPDVSGQHAIQYVKSEFIGQKRMFVAEYDFRAYFENIDHEHIRRILRDRFLVTEVERSAIESFLTVGESAAAHYSPFGGIDRKRGIPQGTSISLLLANVAAWELDRDLERLGVGFVRYADDTLLWSNNYQRICTAVDTLFEHADSIGVSVNELKSPGIHLMVPEETQTAEMEFTNSITYLGHKIKLDAITLKPSAEKKIRERVDQLIFHTLLAEPKSGTQSLLRIRSHVDEDYVSVIARLRRYLYGDLSEKALKRYQTRGAPLRRFKGVMSAYPLIDDTAYLRELDSWILDRLWLAIRKRGQLLHSVGVDDLPVPHGLSRSELRNLSVISVSTGRKIDLSVPSVRRIASVIVAAAAKYGPAAVGKADLYEYE